MNVLNNLKRKFRNFGIPNLMLYISIGQGIVAMFSYLFSNLNLSQHLIFIRENIFQGEVWRILSFILVPPPISLLFLIFVLVLYYSIGNQMESMWGTQKFTLYYLIGVLGSIVCGFICGYATVTYLNLSLFLGYAVLFPNAEFRLYFLIPIKVKYLAYIDAAFLIINMIFVPFADKIAILAAFVNFFIFFGRGFYRKIRNKIRFNNLRSQFNNRNKRER